MTGTIFDIRKYSLHDGPGIRTAVFFKGCPLECAWCHNPESQSFSPELIVHPKRCIACRACVEVCLQAAIDERLGTDRGRCLACGDCVPVCFSDARELVGREMRLDRVMDQIKSDRVFYEQSGGGVTFSGGEPLSQPVFLQAALAACRELGIHTALDTCGHADWEVIDQVRSGVDLFLYDLKLFDEERHKAATGVSNALVLDNLRRLSELGHTVIVRIPIIPGANDDRGGLEQLGAFVAALPGAPPVELLGYHQTAEAKYASLGREYALKGLPSPDRERMQSLAGILSGCGVTVLNEW
ncbi:MAG: glycyl-radical enzyme activating protein [Anaerolineales bacterium]|nr:glycyl-radical enzyme activating protein [Anaerolineales bacterium]